MQKQHAWPEGHWNWPIKISHKHGVRCGNMIWIGGQVDLSPEGIVLNPGDLDKQTRAIIKNIGSVLSELGCDLTDLVNLNCFYVNDGTRDEAAFLRQVSRGLPADSCTAITLIPVPALAYENMLVEIEAIAMRGEDDSVLPRTYVQPGQAFLGSDKFCSAVRCAKMIFVSAQSLVDDDGNIVGVNRIVEQSRAVAQRLKQTLNSFGADFNDVVKTNRWYAGGDAIEDFEPAALDFAANFSEPGPAATGIPLPRHADPEILI